MTTVKTRIISQSQLTAWRQWKLRSLGEDSPEQVNHTVPTDTVVTLTPTLPEPADENSNMANVSHTHNIVVDHQALPINPPLIDLPSLDPADPVLENGVSHTAQTEPLPATLPVATAPPPAPPSQEEIDAIIQNAEQSGYETGLKRAEQTVQNEIQKITALLSGVENAVHALESNMATTLLDFSIELAQHIARQTITMDKQRILPLLQEACSTLPQLSDAAALYLHPDDLETAQAAVAANTALKAWDIIPDPQLEPGSCLIKTSTSAIDLRLSSRWYALLTALGREQVDALQWQLPSCSEVPTSPSGTAALRP